MSTTTTRRTAFALGVAAFVKPPPLPWRGGPRPLGNPDAELLALCAAFHEAHDAWYARRDDFSDAWEEAGERRWAISDQLQGIPAVTEAGRVAKARVALVVLHEKCGRDSIDDLVYAALRDIVGDVA
jgi:hypothetical protein